MKNLFLLDYRNMADFSGGWKPVSTVTPIGSCLLAPTLCEITSRGIMAGPVTKHTVKMAAWDFQE